VIGRFLIPVLQSGCFVAVPPVIRNAAAAAVIARSRKAVPCCQQSRQLSLTICTSFSLKRTVKVLTITLQEAILFRAFLDLTAVDIFLHHNGSWVRGILRDVITQTDIPPMRILLHSDNSNVIGTIHKGQGSNSGENTTMITHCVQLLTCYNFGLTRVDM
jgi:hypothetical protein